MTLWHRLRCRWRSWALLLGIICLILLAASHDPRLDIPWLRTAPTHLQFFWLAVGAVLAGLGLGGTGHTEMMPPSGHKNHIFEPFSRLNERGVTESSPRWQGWTLAAILLLALILRVVNLEETVFMYVDEFGSADAVAQLRDSDQTQLLLPYWEVAGWSRVYPYIQTVAVDLFGTNLTGLRFTTALIGTLTVWAIGLLGTQLFDRRMGLLAAFCLAVFPPHIHFSRLGIPNTVDPLFGTLALALMIRGWRFRRVSDFAWAGVMLGLTQYFYEAGRLLFPLVALGLAGALLVSDHRRKPRLQPELEAVASFEPARSPRPVWNVGVTALAALLVAFPGYYALAANDLSLATRFSQMNTLDSYFTNLRTDPGMWLADQFAPPFLHLVALPDTSHLYYGGSFGLILPWFVPLFLLGVVYALWHWRQPGMFLLLLWVIGVAVGNGFIEQNAYSSRYVVVLPALVLLIVAGIHLLITRWPKYRRGIVTGALVLAGLQVPYYFGPHLALYNQQIRPYYDFAEIISRARDFPAGTPLHLITDDATSQWQFSVLQHYFNIHLPVDVLQPVQLTDAYLSNLPSDVDHAFFVIPQDTASIEQVQQYFGAGEPQPSPHNVPLDRQYFMIYVTAVHQNP